jgi:hypothetical protein
VSLHDDQAEQAPDDAEMDEQGQVEQEDDEQDAGDNHD